MRRALLCLALAGLAGPAGAVIPGPQKVADLVAATNEAAGRAEPLLFEVALRIGDSRPVATGTLASHPTGLARLELRSERGFVERHLLQGSEYRASRDGRLLRDPRPFLPPVFLLQATSGAALRAALASFGVASSDVALGMADEGDCWVLGGRLPLAAGGEERRLPSLWIDMDDQRVVRVDRQDGVRYRFGPAADFGGVRFPAWISIEAPDQAAMRLEVLRVAPAEAPAAAFGNDWLVAPQGP